MSRTRALVTLPLAMFAEEDFVPVALVAIEPSTSHDELDDHDYEPAEED